MDEFSRWLFLDYDKSESLALLIQSIYDIIQLINYNANSGKKEIAINLSEDYFNIL